MKKLIFLSVAFILHFGIVNAKIWRVNNNAGITANFSTAQAANDNAAVQDGDTIHIEPSLTHYGNLTPTKRLTWISVGEFLAANPGQQYSFVTGRIFSINISNVGASFSVFSVSCAGINITVPNISLIKSHISGGGSVTLSTNSNNTTINGCYITGGLSIGASTGNLISNNMIGNSILMGQNAIALIANNIFNISVSSTCGIYNSTVQNNIFITGNSSFTNCIVENNIAVNSLPAGNGNQSGVNLNSIFINPAGGDDVSLQLKAGSPAIGAGINGYDIGAFGGPTPYKLALQPAIPAIYQVSTAALPSGNIMNVTFSTKSNN